MANTLVASGLDIQKIRERIPNTSSRSEWKTFDLF